MTPSERASAMGQKSAKMAEVRRLFDVVAADWPVDEKRDGLAWAREDLDGALRSFRLLVAEREA